MDPAVQQYLIDHPYLVSPSVLMRCFVGEKWQEPPHIAYMNRLLTSTLNRRGVRMAFNMPPQMGKTHIVCRGYPAWRLLHNPDTRIIVVSHTEEYAREQVGKKVKEIIEAFGPPLGLKLRGDTKAGGRWALQGHDGSVTCRGWDSGTSGWSAELFVIDDLIGGEEAAMSPAILDRQWSFYESTVLGRARNETSIVMVGTRWSKRDLFAHIARLAKKTGEHWDVVKFPAICRKSDLLAETGRDILGRREGEALWPEMESLENLKIKSNSRWWSANWQQEPQDQEKAHFRPSRWPTYGNDLRDVNFDLTRGMHRRLVPKDQAVVLVTVDWASTDKKKSDCTAMLVSALLPDGNLLVLDCLNERIRLDEGPLRLRDLCRVWRPTIVAVESGGFQTLLAIECKRHKEIPEPRLLSHESKSKLVRAVSAINMGQNGQIWLPETEAPWLDEFKEQVGSFTGIDDDRDDIVDVLSYACKLAQQLCGPGSAVSEPEILTPAPRAMPSAPYFGV